MELTVSNALYIIGGVIALGIALIIYVYFNGGIENNIEMLLGVIR